MDVDELKEVTENLVGAITLLGIELTEKVTSFVTTYKYQFEVLLVAVTLVSLYAANKKFRSYLRRNRYKRRGERMKKGERVFFVKCLVADMVTDAVEDAVYKGKLTGEEASRVYRQLSYIFSNGELRPRKKTREELARALRKSVMTDLKKKVNIPGPKPGEEIPSSPLRIEEVKEKPRFAYLNRKAA